MWTETPTASRTGLVGQATPVANVEVAISAFERPGWHDPAIRQWPEVKGAARVRALAMIAPCEKTATGCPTARIRAL